MQASLLRAAGLRRLGAIALILTCAAPSLDAAPGPNAADRPEQTHMLFMGADISVLRDKDYFRVRDVSGESFVITVGNRPVFVPMRGGDVGLRFQQSLKLASRQAVVANLKSERAYTPANDPHRRFTAMAASAAAAAASIDVAGGRINNAEVAVHYAQNSPNSEDLVNAQAAADGAVRDLGASAFSAGSDMNNVGASAATLQAELARELYDAIDVSCDVSSEKSLNNPYLVVIARFREPDAKPGVMRNWIYAKSLPPVGPEPRKVQVRQGGFPPGFKLEDCQVHLYDRGQEVATNVAAKRVPLTRDEAFEYLMLEHLAQHKGTNAPATPGLVELPDDLHTRVSGGLLAQPLFVKVTASGTAQGVFQDEECRSPLEDAYIRAVVQAIRFRPALEKGKPVEGVARVRLADLSP